VQGEGVAITARVRVRGRARRTGAGYACGARQGRRGMDVRVQQRYDVAAGASGRAGGSSMHGASGHAHLLRTSGH
jgi:hypothetical protein